MRSAVKGMAVLASMSGLSKLISLASLQVITRLYTPADMGALAVFAAVLMLPVPALTVQYHRALPVPRGNVTAANLLAVALALIVAFSGLLWLGLWGCRAERIAGALPHPVGRRV